ncbi:ABC transporter ATP-binding protein [Fimbriiglobus ruber]|nr:ABC transporter ATP-binding protein [Fimbriiglobus ruber]
MSADDAIVIDRLRLKYRAKPVLDDFSLTVPRGAVYALLGDNGAGKSTTMKVLTGQIRADRGTATVLGFDCWAKAGILRHRVGYVPDRPKLYDWMTVTEIGWFTAGFHKTGFQVRYDDWVQRLRLDPKKRLKDLSKGGYARVGLALALAPDPEVLLLDEPTSGLDLITRREFLGSLVDFAAEGRTILISSHSIAELERTASHAGFVKDGKVVLASTLDGLRSRFRRVAMRCAGVLPDPASLGTVRETVRTGRFVQYLLQDPDPVALDSLRAMPGVTDFEDQAVGLEEIYAAVMGTPPPTASSRPRPSVPAAAEDGYAEEEVWS